MKKKKGTIEKCSVFFISLLIMILAAGCSSTAKNNAMPKMQVKDNTTPKEYTVIAAETRTVKEYLNVDALVCADETRKLFFDINNCSLKGIYVEDDDEVEKGQLLAELDTSNLEDRLAGKQIDLEKLQLNISKIQNEAAIENIDHSVELENLDLDMKAIKLDMKHLRDLISRAQLVAPYAGKVTEVKDIQPGMIIQAYDGLMTISKTGSILLQSVVLNPYDSSGVNLSNIAKGMKVEIIYGSNTARTMIPATITEIINTDPGVQEDPNRVLSLPAPFRLIIKPDGENADLLSIDRTVTLSINTGVLEDAVVLPKTALSGLDNIKMVKVMKGEKIITRKVTISYVYDDDKIVVITNGLRPGEQVVSN